MTNFIIIAIIAIIMIIALVFFAKFEQSRCDELIADKLMTVKWVMLG